MLRSNEVMLTGSVGENGDNRYFDVLAIQQLLDDHLPQGLRELPENGVCDGVMIGTIAEVQRRFHIVANPDGRIDPHGPTLRALNRASRIVPDDPQPPTSAASALPRPQPLASPSPLAARGAPSAPMRGFPGAPAHIPSTPGRPAPHTGAGHAPPPAIIAAAQRSHAQWHIPASITLGQWALESTWGRSMPHASNNPFGIKARKGEKFVLAWTHETVNHVSQRVQRKFRVFNTVDEAFDHHGRMLATYRPYRPALPHRNDPMTYAAALTHVYATDDHYGSKLQRMMQRNNFFQYDH